MNLLNAPKVSARVGFLKPGNHLSVIYMQRIFTAFEVFVFRLHKPYICTIFR